MGRTIDQAPTLKQLQEAVGGWIEEVPIAKYKRRTISQAYVNEEGRIYNLPFNIRATNLMRANNEALSQVEAAIYGPLVLVEKL